MKIKKIFLTGILLFISSAKIAADPLIISNARSNSIEFTAVFSRAGAKRFSIKPQSKWVYDLQNETFMSIGWTDYSDKKNVWCKYKIYIGQQEPDEEGPMTQRDRLTRLAEKKLVTRQLPFIANGGSLIILKEGSYMYETKKGQVHFGKVECTE